MSEVDPRLPYNNIEHLITTEMRPWNLVQGFVRQLYRLARGDGNPITYDLSGELAELSGARAAIVTGIFFEDHFPAGEIDGPIGAAVIASALSKLGHRVDILVEAEVKPVIDRLLERLGTDAGVVLTSNSSSDEVRGWADRYDLAITVEKLGRAADGRRHSIMATPLPPGDSYIDDFIIAMNERGKLTVGLGDGGNEIGFGKFHDQVSAMVPRGKELVTTTATKYLLPAAVSNFGAYAIVAALALRTENQDLLPDGATVVKLIEDAVAEGCLDGGTVDPTFIGDDGIPAEGVAAVVTVLRTIVAQWFTTFDRHF
jgi:hypothetical protein